MPSVGGVGLVGTPQLDLLEGVAPARHRGEGAQAVDPAVVEDREQPVAHAAAGRGVAPRRCARPPGRRPARDPRPTGGRPAGGTPASRPPASGGRRRPRTPPRRPARSA